MKWKNIYLIVFESKDDLSWRTSFSLHLRYNIPLCNIAIFQKSDGHSLDLDKYNGFLSHATLDSKIIILAHGTPDYIDASPLGDMYPINFLDFLYNKMGLRYAGVISFKSCMLGSGFFLDKCKKNCDLLFDRLKVGWWKAYKGIAATHFSMNSCSFSSGEEDYYLRKESGCRDKLTDESRIKLVRGNASISICSFRYNK